MPYTPEHRLATRERILASARRLFNRNGLSEVTIDAVMASAGLTRGAFYNYFNSKEELYAEAITLFSRRFPAEPGATQREDAVGKDAVPVAFDCLESMAPISAAVGGQKLPVFPVETGNFIDFPRATAVWAAKTVRQIKLL